VRVNFEAGGTFDYSRSQLKNLIIIDRVQESIAEAAQTSPGVDVDPVQEAIEIQRQEPIILAAEASPGVEVEQAQEQIEQAAQNSPGVEVDLVEEELPECFECFGDGSFEDESGSIKICQCCSEPKFSRQKAQRAIAPAKISLDAESDQNPILTGIVLSDRFLARYSPPQSETLHYKVITDDYKVGIDGQLSLFEAQVVTEPEPPDPDDFESLDAFREAITLWDSEHNEVSFDHCSEHNEVSFDHCS